MYQYELLNKSENLCHYCVVAIKNVCRRLNGSNGKQVKIITR